MKELQQQNSDAARENGSSVPRSRSRSPLPPTSRILKVRRPEKVDRKQWPFSMTTYMPELDDGIALDSIKGRLFGQALFGPEVAVVVICFHSDDKIKATVCGETELLRCLTETQDGPKFQLFYITMTLQYKLRISAEIFQQLASCYELPMTFIDHLLRYQEQIIHFGHRLQLCGPRDSLIYDF
ncbi:hypothetical protein BDD12DRAFT_116766 [Trichophaea hybrida]|nr:hypothetical protein BDD12DRAFT_116766 [Trichophaea hybrida]